LQDAGNKSAAKPALDRRVGDLVVKELTMQPRLDVTKISPAAYKAVAGLQAYVDQSGLEKSLLELVKIRASQINGCAYCLVMHTNDARKQGETDDRMHLLNAWSEAPVFSARERAALAWTEALTRIESGHVPDAVYEEVRPHFDDKELSDLSLAVAAINAWNRLAISSRVVPGTYQPAPAHRPQETT